LIHRMGVASSEPGVFLGPRDEKGEELGKEIEPCEVQITTIHDVEGTRLGNKDVKNIDVVELSIGDCLYGNCRCTGQCICEIHTSAHSP